MQLIYIWIKKFRNIEGQGFTFSPEYKIQYNQEKQVLEIDKKDFKLGEFFGDNVIGVTGIVGANGSGKSNLLDFIKYRLASFHDGYYTSYDQEGESIIIYDNKIFCHNMITLKNEQELKDQGFDILFFKETLSYAYRDRLKKTGKVIDVLEELYSNTFIFYSNVFDLRNEVGSFMNLNNISTNYLLKQEKYLTGRFYDWGSYKDRIDHIDGYTTFLINEVKRQIDFLIYYKKKLPFQLPQSVRIEIQNSFQNNFLKFSTKWLEDNGLEFLDKLEVEVFNSLNYGQDSNLYKFKLLISFNIFKILVSQSPTYFSNKTMSNFNKAVFEFDFNTIDNEKDFEQKEKLPLITELLSLVNKLIKEEDLLLRSNEKDLWNKFNLGRIVLSEDGIEIFNRFIDAYNKVVLDKPFINLFWTGFSSGQYNMFSLFARLYGLVNHPSITINPNLIILVDEGDSYYHPQWQSSFFSDFINFVKDIFSNKQLQIIIASNSPFIASDLPHSNIIFLNTKNDGKSVVVEGLEKHKQTFGANIYSLFTDAFFMSNTVMGNFAKSKINKLIKILNEEIPYDEEIPDQDVAQAYVDIIGEPILKHQLQKKIDSKRLKKVEEVDTIKNQIKELENRLRRLEEGGNNG